ncbi:MAG: hypothetical protein WA943_15180 [Parvibaculum sp.]|uniref:hypothetical protein n=1 Tax=Parvibaculum sp. TaxID=2024848 RepID=UPI003C794856
MKKKLSLLIALMSLTLPLPVAQAAGLTVGDALSTGPFYDGPPLFVGRGPFDGDPPKDGRPCHKVVRDGPTGDGRMAHWSAQQCYDGFGNAYILRGSERIDGFY